MKKVLSALLCAGMLAGCIAMGGSASAQEQAASYMLGDVNMNGHCDAGDLLLVKRHILNLICLNEYQQKLANTSRAADSQNPSLVKDSIESSDLLLIKREILFQNVIKDISIENTAPLTVSDSPDSTDFSAALAVDKKTVGDTMTSPITGDTYKLKFIDDFNGTILNSSNWSYYTRNYNQAEESVNCIKNVQVQNGNLRILGLKENEKYRGSNESWETPKESYFTGGAINSQGKQEFQYGRLEIMCRVPYSRGMWPAFWTMGTQRGWPWGGEIDIMEMVGGVDQWNNYRDDEYNCGLHWADPNTSSSDAWGGRGHLTRGFANPSKFEIPNGPSQGAKLNDSWLVCGLEWNDKKMYTYCGDTVIGEIDITDSTMREAFHQKHYLILNLVMGGSWAGTPNEKTEFPQQFLVDWVKVWQK